MIRNVGIADRIFRFLFAILLLWLGLAMFDGISGNVIGVLIAITALIPLTMSTTGSCPVFRWFSIHSLSKREYEKYGDPYLSKED